MDLKDYIHGRVIETPQLAEKYTHDGTKVLKTRWAFIKLKKHIDDFFLSEAINPNPNQFIVLSGLRGIGKTTLVMQLYEYLVKNLKVPKSNILYVSVDDITSFLGCSLSDVITTYIEKELQTTPIKLKEKIFIFVDESHFDKNWNLTLKALVDLSKNIFVIATGSSALLLDITTDSARRITKEPLFPLSFSEYLTLNNDRFYPPTGMSKDIRGLILNGLPDLIPYLNGKENELSKTCKENKIYINEEILSYFRKGGFAFTMNRNERDSYGKIMDLVDRIIRKDLTAFRNFDSNILTRIFRMICLMALKKGGELSHSKLATTMGVSPDTVSNILDTLEKTQLIFSIKPMISSRGVKSWAGSPWKYYFLSPTLTYSIRYTLGKTELDNDTQGLLWENLVACTLFRISKTISRDMVIFYDRDKNGVDFLLQNEGTDKIIPIEVGLNKDSRQITDAIKRFQSDYGILISNSDKIIKEDKIIHIPFKTFVFA